MQTVQLKKHTGNLIKARVFLQDGRLLLKAKKAEVGEIRTYSGKQYKKVFKIRRNQKEK